MKAVERFLRYVTFDTQSCEKVRTTPSTSGQQFLAEVLADELRQIGLIDVELDAKGYLMATLPPVNPREGTPVIGFIAHLDTSPDISGKDVKPRILTYSGGDIVLNAPLEINLSPSLFPELNNYVGQELVVTDGSTLLGADDKAGIAAIVSAVEYLTEHPEIPHGKIRIAFTPDEEIGRGTNFFDVRKFGCEWAYTVDGGEIGELEYENFNAAEVNITILGRNTHPGYARNKMVNAALVAVELINSIPVEQRPEYTSGHQGFYHLTHFTGNVDKATLSYLIRDHDRVLFEEKKWILQYFAQQLNRKYPGCMTVKMRDQYYNMREIVAPKKEIIQLASDAMKAVGVTPCVKPVRGGTDGARLSFAGLPCPNLFTGGVNPHGRYEFLPVPSLEKSVETIIQMIKSV